MSALAANVRPSVPDDRRPLVRGDLCFLQLTRGYVTVLDAADVEVASGYLWYAMLPSPGCVYATRGERTPEGRLCSVLLHRVLIGAPDGLVVDHVDGDTLNNRRANLRLATRAQNGMNRGPQVNNTSGFKGVKLCRKTGRWEARIQVAGRQISLGRFSRPEDAHKAYVDALPLHHGDFGRAL